MSKRFHPDNKISSFLDICHLNCAPLATWWLLHSLTAFSVTPFNGHLAMAYPVFQLSISSF